VKGDSEAEDAFERGKERGQICDGGKGEEQQIGNLGVQLDRSRGLGQGQRETSKVARDARGRPHSCRFLPAAKASELKVLALRPAVLLVPAGRLAIVLILQSLGCGGRVGDTSPGAPAGLVERADGVQLHDGAGGQRVGSSVSGPRCLKV
jgi:hypothetical protein